MLKFENIARVGDRIRAYDFQPIPGRGECYVDGLVTDISEKFGFKAFVIHVYSAFWSGVPDENRVGREIYVPMEIGGISEWDYRVSNLSVNR